MASSSLPDQSARLLKAMTTHGMRARIKHVAKIAGSMQRPTDGDNIFIFSTPRSGSTWLMELILSQPSFRACDQPMDIRSPYVRRHLGISNWVDLYQRNAEEQLKPYFQAICDGRIRGLTTLLSHHRIVSRRLVFKIQNGWQERIGWMRDSFGGQIVLLLRHPMAVTLSRKQLPRLEAFIQSGYATHFDNSIMKLARQLIDKGSFFEKGVLHWCFENAVPLRMIEKDWFVVTYEQLVTDPETVLMALSEGLNLPDLDAMMRHVEIPSRTISKSNAETQALINSGARDRLIGKWRKQIAEEEERAAFEIVEAFGIDAYRPGSNMPIDDYLIRPHRADPAPDLAEL